MRRWTHAGGFSLDATVRREATDRKGLESQSRDWFADTCSVDNSRCNS